ncbi:MAG: hypothetical protein J0H43_09435 [Actinobacteria bacterium]|nr:hypothetical protein [Actinomycetota bacterium]
MYRARNPQADAELRRLLAERDARLAVYDDLEERLEVQRLREWADYGQALKARVEVAAADIDGLTVPVEITLDLAPMSGDLTGGGSEWGLVDQLLDTAGSDTPTPADLSGTPLERLEQPPPTAPSTGPARRATTSRAPRWCSISDARRPTGDISYGVWPSLICAGLGIAFDQLILIAHAGAGGSCLIGSRFVASHQPDRID